ncbi:MAG TPA: HD domain-containing protein [Candidatus Saccharimonadia bacterium]|jgi:(p)ppGpp synthase/HD superfamily hydrolase|nr:HD domain-containing protein [Candidatus Saccharimonadia bacterium]
MRSKHLRDDPELYGVLSEAAQKRLLPRRGLSAVCRACEQAWDVHLYQTRETGDPYIVHPDAVVRKLVLDMHVYDVVVIVDAYLHDGAEDQLHRIMPLYRFSRNVAVYLLRRKYGRYGPEVIADLQILTKPPAPEGATREEKDRIKVDYLLKLAIEGSWRALIVKLADRWHNIVTLHARSRGSQIREAQMTLEVFPLLVEALLERAPMQYHAAIRELWEEIQRLCQSYL